MAKKRKKSKEPKEEYEFKPPEFDEKEFLEKEIRDTRVVFLTVGYGVLFGAIAGILAAISDDLIILGAVLLFGGLFSITYFYRLVKVDTTQFQKKNWAGNVAWFFLTFLAIWVLTFNYPIADHAHPTITDITIWVAHDGNLTAIDYEYVESVGAYSWVPRWGEDLATLIQSSATYTVNISARIADNGNLGTVLISVGGASFQAMSSEGDHRFGLSIFGDDIVADALAFEIRATDDAGNVAVFTPPSIPVS